MRTYSPSLLFSPSLVVAFDAVVYARLLSPPHSPSLCVNRYKTRERERERENVSGAVLENAFERELKMKDTSQIGKIAYEFLSLSFPSFSVC